MGDKMSILRSVCRLAYVDELAVATVFSAVSRNRMYTA